MQKRLISYSMLLLAAALIFGCSSADRVEEQEGIVNDPQVQLPNSGGELINDDNSTNSGGSVTNDENATVGTIKIDAKNAYKISVSFSDTYNQKGSYSIDEIGQLNFNITNIYTNEPADTSIIENITLEAEEKISDTAGKYFNFITYSGEEGPTYSIPSDSVKATDTVAIRMKELSGTANIILSASIKLKDGDITPPYKLTIPLVIEKNKSSSMAIVPMGSSYENGLFIDKFVIHVVDSYGNRAIDGTRVSTGLVNNPKLYSNAYNGGYHHDYSTATTINFDDQTLPREIDSNYVSKIDYDSVYHNYRSLFYSLKNDKASLDKSSGTLTLPYTIPETITALDTVIVIANKDQYKPANLGGWGIQTIDRATNKLSLDSLDFGNDVDGVHYVIGDDYRYDQCSQTIMNAASSSFESTDVVDGVAFAELRYTPDMVGKNVFIYANSRLDDKHIGVSRKVYLTGTGLSTDTLSCKNESETQTLNCSGLLRITQNGSGKLARNVYVAQPIAEGTKFHTSASASRTDCGGWTHVKIYGIPPEKTATVTVGGDYIADELVINHQ